MNRAYLIAALAFLAGCAGATPVVRPVPEGGNKADGIVTMSSTASIFQPSPPDWRAAEAGPVARRCRAWGYGGGQTFTGWREDCRVYRHGRCVTSQVRRFYQCKE